MTRRELITSDDYIIASLECIVVSKKGVFEMRKELTEWTIKLKNELLESPSGSVSEAPIAINSAAIAYATEKLMPGKSFDEFIEASEDPDRWFHNEISNAFIAGSNYSQSNVGKCNCKNRKGETSVMCCNDCGLPTEDFWIIPNASKVVQEEDQLQPIYDLCRATLDWYRSGSSGLFEDFVKNQSTQFTIKRK